MRRWTKFGNSCQTGLPSTSGPNRLRKNSDFDLVLKGRGFSRAVSATKSIAALDSLLKRKQKKSKTFLRMRVGWLSSTGDLGRHGEGESRAKLGTIEGSIVLKHAENRVQQLPHDGDQGHHFAFPTSLQMQIKGAQVRSKAHRSEGGHVKRPANMPVAHLADARFLMHRAARLMVPGIESRVSDPLPHVAVGGNQHQFAQQLQSTDRANPGRALQQPKAALKFRSS